MVCLSVQNCTHVFITVPVCVCTLNYPVSNKNTNCYIAVYGLSVQNCTHVFITVPVCVCTLNYPVSNKHTNCYIAVYGLSVQNCTNFLITVPVSENITEHKICVLCCSANFLILKNNSERYECISHDRLHTTVNADSLN